MRSCVVLLALLPVCFAAPNVQRSDEDADQGLQAGRSCLRECQISVNGHFNLSINSRPRDFPEYCEFAGKLIECFEKCPYNPASPLTKQDAEINARICGRNFTSEQFQEFLAAQNRMSEQWALQMMSSCPKQSENAHSSRIFEKCSLFLDCFFGDALNAVKDGYDDLVVASVVVPLKLEFTLKIGDGVLTDEIVDECSILFAPDTSFMPAAWCLVHCQSVVPAKYPDIRQSENRQQKAAYCEYSGALNACLEKCQESPITPIITQSARVHARICGPDFGEEQLKAFLDDEQELVREWFTRAESCAANSPHLAVARPDWGDLYGNCGGFLNCFFGEAFDAAKEDFDELVVAATSAQFKFQYAWMLGRGEWTKDVVDECLPVFMRYEARNVSSMA